MPIDVRGLVHHRITDVIAAIDDHDPGLEYPSPVGRPCAGVPTYVCPDECGFRGTEAEWQQHLAEAIGAALTTVTVELPAVTS